MRLEQVDLSFKFVFLSSFDLQKCLDRSNCQCDLNMNKCDTMCCCDIDCSQIDRQLMHCQNEDKNSEK